MRELENKIKEMIECTYECIFKGKVEVKKLGDSYQLRLSLNQPERPIWMTYQGDEDDFLKYLKDEFKKRRLSDTEYYTGVKNEQRRNY